MQLPIMDTKVEVQITITFNYKNTQYILEKFARFFGQDQTLTKMGQKGRIFT